MIIQNEPVSPNHRAELSFTVPKNDLGVARRTLEPLARELELEDVVTDEEIGSVSLVGAGMRTHPGVAAKVFETLGEHEINIEIINTSPIKISCVIRAEQVPEAVRALHAAFGLEGQAEREQAA
jgi:aspartate kinase